MAKLVQSESEFKTYLGWYGNCNQTCESYNLENVSDKVMIVYEYTTAGALRIGSIMFLLLDYKILQN